MTFIIIWEGARLCPAHARSHEQRRNRMYVGPIVVLVVGTLAVLLVPAVMLAGNWPGRKGKHPST